MTEQYADSTGRYGHAVDHDDLLETIADLESRDETLPGGGVSLDTLTDHSPFARDTLATHCRRLAERGDLEREWGIGPNKPQRTYSTAESTDQ